MLKNTKMKFGDEVNKMANNTTKWIKFGLFVYLIVRISQELSRPSNMVTDNNYLQISQFNRNNPSNSDIKDIDWELVFEAGRLSNLLPLVYYTLKQNDFLNHVPEQYLGKLKGCYFALIICV